MKHTHHILALAVLMLCLATIAFAQGGGDMQQVPPSGVRSYLPLLLLVGIYLFVRRTFKRMNDDDGPFGSGRDFHPRQEEEEPEEQKDAYDNARKTWDAFNARPDAHSDAQPDTQTGEHAAENGQQRAKVIDLKPAAPASQPEPDKTEQPSAPGPGAGEADDDDFLMGARLVFERLVEAMDGLDPDAASQFAVPAVVNDIKHRINEGHPPAQSEVIKIDCSVMERKAVDGAAWVTVYYDAVKQVSGIGPVQVRQLWTFTKDDNDPAAMWMLESMEPVEA